jgi:hypothetical protein
MHCNAFSSGLYCHLAIVNHSCRPNCIKFAPSAAVAAAAAGKLASFSSPSSSVSSSSRTDCSEIRAVAAIAAGEPITISYLTPCDQTRARRRHALRTQFRFECNCERCGDEDRVGLVSSEPLKSGNVGSHTSGEWQCEALLCPACAPAALTISADSSKTSFDTSFCNISGGDGGDDAVRRVFALPHLPALDGIALVRTRVGDSVSSHSSQWHCPACARVVSAAAMAACARHMDSIECELDALECDMASDNFTAARALRSAMPALRTLRARLDDVMDGGDESTATAIVSTPASVSAASGGVSASTSCSASASGAATAGAASTASLSVTNAATNAAATNVSNLSAVVLHPHHVLNVRFHRLRFDAAATALSAVRRQAAASSSSASGKLANHAHSSSVTAASSSSANGTGISPGTATDKTAGIGTGSATSTGSAASTVRTASIVQQHCALLLESALASVRLRPLILGDGATAGAVSEMNGTGAIYDGGGGSWHCDMAKAWQDVVFALGEWRKAAEKTTPAALSVTFADQCSAYAQRRFDEISACYDERA